MKIVKHILFERQKNKKLRFIGIFDSPKEADLKGSAVILRQKRRRALVFYKTSHYAEV